MDKIILLLCSLISCIIITSILFQFWNDRYRKSFANAHIYIALPAAMILIVMAVNMFMNTLLNFAVNIVLVALISYFFYYEESKKQINTMLESEVLTIVLVISETLGVFLIDSILSFFNIMPESIEIQRSIETAFSKLILLFLYYIVFSKMWKKYLMRTKAQYILYTIMFLYSAVNIIGISAIADQKEPIILLIIFGFTIFANMYLLYFVKFTDERNYYKAKSDMMEQQVELQFGYYKEQSEKYDETRAILHDIDNHIKMIEKLYQGEKEDDALDYTQKIRDMLLPLTPYKYTGNPILNCLLTDKSRTTDKLNIKFDINLDGVDVDFMELVDITTLFGNLIDNAITACKRCSENRFITLDVKQFHDMISISIENCINDDIIIKNDKIVVKREGNRGIGLMNIRKCIDKYDGSILYKISGNILICHILLNNIDS